MNMSSSTKKILTIMLISVTVISLCIGFYYFKQSSDSEQKITELKRESSDSEQKITELKRESDFLKKENEIRKVKADNIDPDSLEEETEEGQKKVSVLDVNSAKSENGTPSCYVEFKSNIEINDEYVNSICEFLVKRTQEISTKRDVFISFNGESNSIVSGVTLLSPFLFKVSGNKVEVIFERNDAPLCSEIDGLGIATLYSKCLEAGGAVRYTRD